MHSHRQSEQPQRPRLLLVEDDQSSARALKLLLGSWGFDVLVAGTIAEAQPLLDAGEPFTHLLLDLMLPDGDGAVLLQDVRRRQLPMWVAITTGVADPDRLRAVQDLSPSMILRKPIDLDKLQSVLR